MLAQELEAFYRKLRLRHYKELFGKFRERDGSLSATEAFAADVVYLLGNPTVSNLAETLGISQPNATYKINNLESKGYVVRSVSNGDRRECRVSVADRFYTYYDTDYPFISHALEKLAADYTPEELALFGAMLKDLNKSMES